jgi:hypothetical protein
MAADRTAGAETRDLDARDTAAPTDGSGAAAAAAAPTTGTGAGENLPGSVTAPALGSLFGESDAQTFRERWREVQLRFVDSPKEATGEAAAMLDEAVEKLSTNLRAQKDSLKQDSEDTEQLRVQLRGYRDMINRILDL